MLSSKNDFASGEKINFSFCGSVIFCKSLWWEMDCQVVSDQ